MNEVPHNLIVEVNAEIELEEKCRRMAARALMVHARAHAHAHAHAPTHAQVKALEATLRAAHQSKYGCSNLTAWRIITEWNDLTAMREAAEYVTAFTPRTKTKTEIQKPNPKTKPKNIIPPTSDFAH